MILRVEEPVPEYRKPLLLQAVDCGIYSQKLTETDGVIDSSMNQ